MNKKILTVLIGTFIVTPIFSNTAPNTTSGVKVGISTQFAAAWEKNSFMGGAEVKYHKWRAGAYFSGTVENGGQNETKTLISTSLGREFTLSKHASSIAGIQWDFLDEHDSDYPNDIQRYSGIGLYLGVDYMVTQNISLFLKVQPITFEYELEHETGESADKDYNMSYFTNGSIGVTYFFS